MRSQKYELKSGYNFYANAKKTNLLLDIVCLFKKKGVIKSIRKLLMIGYYIFIARNSFVFNNKKYHYFYHRYGYTLDSERAVEVPIVIEEIKRNKGKRILEVGNVLSHYYKAKWGVVDKFERGKGVINQDIVDFRPTYKYDLIASISTLEHVGYDDDAREPMRIVEATKNLKENCLKKDGKIIVTLPLGYNKAMDKLLFKDRLGFDELYFLRRISKNNRWRQIKREEAKNIKYDSPFPHGNGVVVGIILQR